MATFVILDENDIVTRVFTMADKNCLDENGLESEAVGIEFIRNTAKDQTIKAVKTSYNDKIKKQFAGKGFWYDRQKDIFVKPQPFPSWAKDENSDWQPPVEKPVKLENQTIDWNENKYNNNEYPWDIITRP